MLCKICWYLALYALCPKKIITKGTCNHKTNIRNGFLALNLSEKEVFIRYLGHLRKILFYLDGQLHHFGFLALLKCAQGSQTGMGAYFDVNALKFQNQPSNFTIVKITQLCSKFPPTALLNFACDG